MYHHKFASRILLAPCLGLFLTGCLDSQNNPAPPVGAITMNVETPGSAYYAAAINGPRYAVIVVKNNDPAVTANITGIIPPENTAINILSRTGSGIDTAYGNYAQCAATANSNLNQVNTLAPGGECIIVLDGGNQHFIGTDTGTLTISGSNPAFSRTFTLSDTGYLYAGGDFTMAGDNPANYIAKWDGSTWSALGDGVSGGGSDSDVRALATDNTGNVYAGGDFTMAGGNPANYIAKWNGNAWSALGDGVGGGSVLALTTDSAENVYAGGDFTTLDGGTVTANYSAEWNGSTWSALGSGIGGAIYALMTGTDNTVYATGNTDPNPNNFAYKWDGANWSPLTTGAINTTGYALTNSNDTIYAGMLNFIASTVGSGWQPALLNSNSTAYTLAADSNGNIYAGGNFTSIGGQPLQGRGIAEKNNSGNWVGLDSGISGGGATVYALTVDKDNHVYAGGNFTSAGSVSVTNIAKWNGSAWSQLGTGIGAANTNAVRALTTGNVLQVQ